MDEFNPQEMVSGMDEDARVQIAQRVGAHLIGEDLPAADRRAAELLAYSLARDTIERVRTALSVAIRQARHLPRDLAMTLAHDVDAVACPFLGFTDVFSDAEWQSLILTISRSARITVAGRESMNDGLACLLAEMGDSVVAETLIENPHAPMSAAVCDVLLDRFAPEIWVIDKLADRDDLLADIVVRLLSQVSAAAREKLAATYMRDDLTDSLAMDAETAALLDSIKSLTTTDLVAAAETLHGNNRLTLHLLLAAARNGQPAFFEIGLSVVSGRSLAHIRSVLGRADEKTVRRLFAKIGVPGHLMEDFWAEVGNLRRAQVA